MEQIVYEYCTSEFLKFVGIDYQDSILSFMYFYPLLEGWNSSDRRVACVVFIYDSKSEGSHRGSGI